ncbi:ABC transporter substrate-binding protein [Phytoactinopolyspora halotolerans]|uniref:Carbohydrate ABC transporter substrate-binding protein n=1 Tax=Phytoactinopolyspora halotolerans TaxID=1981512 RepID=A0A6L9S7E7_9ACTN|nr:ABC transporter substrate-binding protein [Phytoactinopolyspora halotolerans]NED99909.1 carbohydrate ABC transporter substrate-binding protein [Phytoactinopolyspora halotolerans]
MSTMDRRTFLKTTGAGALGATALLSACGSDDGSAPGGPTSVRYAWWGNNIRQQNYTTALELFQEEHPDITIETEFAEYTAFQERMTTQMAARDVPDIFWIASAQVMTYEKNGLYRSLEGLDALDLSDFSDQDIEFFKLNGELNTMPHGSFVPVVRYNQTYLEEDGYELPGDADWTWENLADFLIDYNDNNPNGRRGLPYDADHDISFEAWLRQHGQQLWTEDGEMGFDAEALAGWFEWWERLRTAGAALSISEQDGIGPDWAEVGERVLVKFGSSNHIIDEAQVFPDSTFKLRPAPAIPDAAAGHKFIYYPRLAVYQGIDDAQAQAAASVVSFNINSVDFLKTVGLTMGAPPNPRLLQEAYEFASDDEQEMLAVVESETDAERSPRYEAPAGTSTWRTVMSRAAEEIALERSGIAEASEAMIAEIQAGIDQEK